MRSGVEHQPSCDFKNEKTIMRNYMSALVYHLCAAQCGNRQAASSQSINTVHRKLNSTAGEPFNPADKAAMHHRDVERERRRGWGGRLEEER